MSKTRDMLLERRQEILKALAPMITLQAELSEVERALTAIGVASEPAPEKLEPTAENQKPATIPKQAIALLGGAPGGLTTGEVVDRMRLEFGRDTNSRNMSWHLSRMKKDELIIQVGDRWKLPS